LRLRGTNRVSEIALGAWVVNAYLRWLDRLIDPAAGVSFWTFYWRYKLLYLLHLVPTFFLLIMAEIVTGSSSSLYVAAIILFAIVALALPIFFFSRRAILSSRIADSSRSERS
jgi:hypothetical protein